MSHFYQEKWLSSARWFELWFGKQARCPVHSGPALFIQLPADYFCFFYFIYFDIMQYFSCKKMIIYILAPPLIQVVTCIILGEFYLYLLI